LYYIVLQMCDIVTQDICSIAILAVGKVHIIYKVDTQRKFQEKLNLYIFVITKHFSNKYDADIEEKVCSTFVPSYSAI